jgi:hypothetical protein
LDNTASNVLCEVEWVIWNGLLTAICLRWEVQQYKGKFIIYAHGMVCNGDVFALAEKCSEMGIGGACKMG